MRAPTGLHSELMAYLRKLGIRKNLDPISRNIVNEETVLNRNTKTGKIINKVAVSFGKLKVGLEMLNLHLWGGKSNGGISVQSWETESSGAPTGERIDSLDPGFIKRLEKSYKSRKKYFSLYRSCCSIQRA